MAAGCEPATSFDNHKSNIGCRDRNKKAAWWRIAEAHRHVECPNRQVLLHPVADRPADDPAAMKIKDNGEVEPAFCRPDIGDIVGRFSVS